MRLRYLLSVAALLLVALYLNLVFGLPAWVYLVAVQAACLPLLLGLIEAEMDTGLPNERN